MGKNNKSSKSDWKDMSYDVLLRIFMTLNVVDFAAVSLVCSSWRDVCQDALFWDGKVLDLTKWKDPRLSNLSSRLISLLKCLLNLSSGRVDCLIFKFQIYLDDREFNNIAKKSLNLKRLVLPAWFPDLSKKGIDQAMQQWEGLESLTITNNYLAPHFLESIGKYCNNLRELKLTCHLTIKIARILTKNVPNLKVLSLQSVRVNKNALLHVVKKLKELKVLNLTHSFVVSGNRTENMVVYPKHVVQSMMENMPRKPRFLKCKGFCVKCQEVFIWNMMNKWKEPKEIVWRNDKIPSLRV
ncbi:F-box/LRR-repeat protein At3g48880-like [Prosopis cineraria]|uniref:F-box/LRR-repeat protein At3g48880-like n=1 Tax=Prosopis cineraria TaxID=364024 RepID=UPI00240F4823|nr:F-box/LRR-repeat protein At3g48880-like [Prosopis cineraria]